MAELAFNLSSSMAAHTRGVGFATDVAETSVTLADGHLRFWSDGSGYSNYGRRIDPDDDYIPFPLSDPDPIESTVQPALPLPLGFPVVARGSNDSHANDWLNSLTFPPENLLQSASAVPLAFPVLAPFSADSREAYVDINVYNWIHGNATEFLLRETARSLVVELIGELRPCTV